MINQGTIIQDGPSNLELDGITNLDNQGTYTFQGDGTERHQHQLRRERHQRGSGTITKAAGTGNSVINTGINNNRRDARCGDGHADSSSR